jgi:hypothetical protein
VLLFSCKSLDPASNPGPATPTPPAISAANVPLQIPQQTVSKLLNSQIPAVLLQEKGLDMGSGIIGDLQLKRNGQITWVALDSQRIQLTVPITVLGEVGLKPKGLGSLLKTKLPLNENFSPVFVIDPIINPNWSIGAENFELLDLGGNLAIDILGMQVDLSGLLSKEIRKWGTENLTGGKEIASLKTLIELAWAQVGKPFSVDWIGGSTAFSIQPQEVKLKEFFDTEQNYNLWLGLDGKINTHPADAAPSRAFPLPGLSENQNSANEFEMLMPLTVAYSTLDELLEKNLDGQAIRVDKKTTMIPSNIKTQAFGDLLAVSMDFVAEQTTGKTLSGTLFVVGQPQYNKEAQSLVFEDINFKMESGSFSAQTGVGLKKGKIIRSIEKKAVFPIGDLLTKSLGSINDRLGLSTPFAALQLVNLKVEPAGFYPMAKELVIHMRATGQVDVQWK